MNVVIVAEFNPINENNERVLKTEKSDNKSDSVLRNFMNERILRIRESERKSHTEIYTNEKLYSSDSWLQKPIKTVKDIVPLFEDYNELRVLDLGCGVGRNSIFIAEKFKKINCIADCVDLLEIAIEKLTKNADERDVASCINGIVKSIEEFYIKENYYDFIMAVSALEHTDSFDSFVKKMSEIKNGLRENGIVCLVINSNVREVNRDTQETVDVQFEVNLPTEKVQDCLCRVFNGWKLIKASVSGQEYDIPRETFVSHLSTDVVTYVARRTKQWH